MERLVDEIKRLKSSKTGRVIRERIEEFISLHDQDSECWFSELCFCLLTANCSAELGIRVQQAIGQEFSSLPRRTLVKELRRVGYRFPNRRAQFIVEARKYSDIKKVILQRLEDNNQERDIKDLREWLVKNIKGLGYKEVSHYLRNVGYLNVAILDRHILRILLEYGLIDDIPRTLTRRKYLEIESIVNRLAERVNLSIGELDLYLWHMRTGKILK
ncbi:MAG: N-glycosylase/DNA lyase [Candidatus Hodarchaeota archaeon]